MPQCAPLGIGIECAIMFGNDGVEIPFTVKQETGVELVTVERL